MDYNRHLRMLERAGLPRRLQPIRRCGVQCLRHRDKESTLTAFREQWEAKYYLPRRFRHDNDAGFVDLDAFLTGAGVFREEIPPHTPELDGQNDHAKTATERP